MIAVQLGAEIGPFLSTFGIPAIVASAVAGIFGVLVKKEANKSPDILSGGYSTLVSDLQLQITVIRARVKDLEESRAIDQETISELKKDRSLQRATISELRRRVDWMLTRLTNEDREVFHIEFGPDHLLDEESYQRKGMK